MTEPTSIVTDSVEQWRQVAGFAATYSVSNFGRVRRDTPAQGTRAGRILACHLSERGYMRVGLTKPDSSSRLYMVHQLVAAAFIGQCPEGCEINHRNLVKTDNRAGNLEYTTHPANVRHAFDNRVIRRAKGSQNSAAKLHESDVVVIRTALAEGTGLGTLAKRFGVSKPVIVCIRDRETWKHV